MYRSTFGIVNTYYMKGVLVCCVFSERRIPFAGLVEEKNYFFCKIKIYIRYKLDPKAPYQMTIRVMST